MAPGEDEIDTPGLVSGQTLCSVQHNQKSVKTLKNGLVCLFGTCPVLLPEM